MFQMLRARFFQGYRTGAFPPAAPKLPPRFLGRPVVAADADVEAANALCPVHAFGRNAAGRPGIDTGKCIFCGECASCPGVTFTREYRLGAMSREALFAADGAYTPEEQKRAAIRSLCGQSLKIRQVSAGGCAACELDFNVLHTLAWDMGRFGIQAVASPRHADALLVTGPVTKNMLLALQKCYECMPQPGFVIASGACAVSGGLYLDSPECAGPVDRVLKVDLYVPGCPPHPATLLEALLRFIGSRVLQKERA